MILSAWPMIPIILSVRSCYTLYMVPCQTFRTAASNQVNSIAIYIYIYIYMSDMGPSPT